MSIDTWDKLVALPNPKFRALVEVNPSQEYTPGSDWSSEGSNTYSHTCSEVEVNIVTDDGVEMVEKASVAEVKAAAGSWYFDLANQTIYVHCFDGDDLSNIATDIVVMVYCWKYWASDNCVLDGKVYKALVAKDSLPAFDSSVDDIVEGFYKLNFSSLRVMNVDRWFDVAAAVYVWFNRVIRVKLGGESLPYSEYGTYFVGRIADYSISDAEIKFSVKDIREATLIDLPKDCYWAADFPPWPDSLPDSSEGLPIQILYGVKNNIVPVLIRGYEGVPCWWQIADRPIKQVREVRVNGVPVSGPGPDLWWDYLDEDKNTISCGNDPGLAITLDADGVMDGGGALITKASDIAKDILKYYLGFLDADLDLPSFANTASLRPAELCIYLDSTVNAREILQTIARSVGAFFVPTAEGKLAFVVYEEDTPSGTLELVDRDYFSDWKVEKDVSYVRSGVRIGYNGDPVTHALKYVELLNPKAAYRYGVQEAVLELETYLKNKTDAEDLAAGVQEMTSGPITVASTSIGVKGFKLFPTQPVILSRTRAVDESGSFDKKVFRLRQVVKDLSLQRTTLTAMDNFQLGVWG